MNNAGNAGQPAAGGAGVPGLPPVADRATFQAELDRLRVREKAHTREGDAIAAARRRLPMAEMDVGLTLTGPDGPVTLLDAFEGRRQGWGIPWYSAKDSVGTLLAGRQIGLFHLVCYLRDGDRVFDWPPVPVWPGGRPIAQWPRLAAGRSDDLAGN